eukprot:3055769-Amphidinium_carterae.2
MSRQVQQVLVACVFVSPPSACFSNLLEPTQELLMKPTWQSIASSAYWGSLLVQMGWHALFHRRTRSSLHSCNSMPVRRLEPSCKTSRAPQGTKQLVDAGIAITTSVPGVQTCNNEGA